MHFATPIPRFNRTPAEGRSRSRLKFLGRVLSEKLFRRSVDRFRQRDEVDNSVQDFAFRMKCSRWYHQFVAGADRVAFPRFVREPGIAFHHIGVDIVTVPVTVETG